ncbi:MAG: hypothetical protein M1839_008582 [Geoglossum umbratile]|nr:MAG: hypothetical protein M1839_008582 [Geoglossum umbratile]
MKRKNNEGNDKETVQVTTLEEGNGYDIPILGGTAVIDFSVWTRDLGQPDKGYKGTIIWERKKAKWRVGQNVSDDCEPEVAAAREGITDTEVVSIYVENMSVGQSIRLHHPMGKVFEIKLLGILGTWEDGIPDGE